uniref:tRNA pseudouridine synthase n=1 Tax=Cacopsylla melanoneura TaxID=428564 RepID=A0A8D9ETS6_9HEMI
MTIPFPQINSVFSIALVYSSLIIQMDTSTPIAGVRCKRKLDEKSLMELPKEDLVQKILTLKEQLAKVTAKADKKVMEVSIKKKKKKPFDFSKVKMRSIVLKVLYQGWNYHGFQIQSLTKNTIAQHIMDALQKTCLIENKEKANFACSGRTDMAVSAFCQVISVSIRSKLNSPGVDNDDDELDYLKMLNSNLPRDIRVVAWSPVPEKFSARFDCLFRNYKYWFPRAGLDIDEMNKAAQYLVGTHDFRNLCKMNVANGVVIFNRTVTHASIRTTFSNNQFNDSDHDMCEFNIRSQAFLWHQIRCIMSVLFMIGQGKEKPDVIQHLFDIDNCPRKPVYPMVMGEPLNLYRTEFDPSVIDWRYGVEVEPVLRDLHQEWSLTSIKASMLGEMMKDLKQESKSCFEGNVNHLIEGKEARGMIPQEHVPLKSRPTCESLENRIRHYVKKKKIELVSDPYTEEAVTE